MAYITSRGLQIPRSKPEMREARCWFNMWRSRQWPYGELESGDILYWYEVPTRRLVWETRITVVEKFPYRSKEEVVERLLDRFEYDVDRKEPYFVDAPKRGYCLAWRVEPVRSLALAKPEGVHFPRLGWWRVNDAAAQGWSIADRASAERLTKLNLAIATARKSAQKEEAKEGEKYRAEATFRKRNRALIEAKKAASDGRCDVCRFRFKDRYGRLMPDCLVAHHVKPIGRRKRSAKTTLEDIALLCPNCHAAVHTEDPPIPLEKIQKRLRA